MNSLFLFSLPCVRLYVSVCVSVSRAAIARCFCCVMSPAAAAAAAADVRGSAKAP